MRDMQKKTLPTRLKRRKKQTTTTTMNRLKTQVVCATKQGRACKRLPENLSHGSILQNTFTGEVPYNNHDDSGRWRKGMNRRVSCC